MFIFGLLVDCDLSNLSANFLDGFFGLNFGLLFHDSSGHNVHFVLTIIFDRDGKCINSHFKERVEVFERNALHLIGDTCSILL